ncbi:MAG: hypothetical protein JNM25_15740 [Planctomycetes bacterium]|nr:hypothetical protein [Planctomycetota bacterium]
MRLSPSVRLALPLLCFLVPLSSCKGPPQPAEVNTAGLRISVLRVKNGRKGIDMTVRIFNDHDQRVSFDIGGVRLICPDGSEMSPNASRSKPNVQAKNSQDFRWLFSYQNRDPLPAGMYDLEIKDIFVGDIQLDMRAQFQANVGG